jgi:hypothetical protein
LRNKEGGVKIELWQFILLLAVIVLGPAGAAYVGVKASLNGFKAFTMDKLTIICSDVKELNGKVVNNEKDIAVLKVYHNDKKR